MPHASGKPCLGSLHAAARQPNAPHRAEGPPAAAARSSRAARHAARDSRSPARPASPERANSQRGKNSLATGLPPSLSLSSPPSPSLDLCLARCVIATGNTHRPSTSISACSRHLSAGPWAFSRCLARPHSSVQNAGACANRGTQPATPHLPNLFCACPSTSTLLVPQLALSTEPSKCRAHVLACSRRALPPVFAAGGCAGPADQLQRTLYYRSGKKGDELPICPCFSSSHYRPDSLLSPPVGTRPR